MSNSGQLKREKETSPPLYSAPHRFISQRTNIKHLAWLFVLLTRNATGRKKVVGMVAKTRGVGSWKLTSRKVFPFCAVDFIPDLLPIAKGHHNIKETSYTPSVFIELGQLLVSVILVKTLVLFDFGGYFFEIQLVV